ncbi:MAG: DUF1501 domain-containing protein [Planctomycetaceae bacterium]|nr:DUF1501 domain-containing protein [Planctomycetaceae bacterium]
MSITHCQFPTRRQFLGYAGLSFVSVGALAPRMFAQVAAESAAADRNDHTLVAIELTGGNDGLNTLIPFENALYYANRRTLGIPKENVHRLSDQVGLHPAMEPLAELFKQGKLAVVQGVGYPEPDRSHFRSMEIWHTASTDKRPPTTGWLGRVVDSLTSAKNEDAIPGLAFTGALPQAFQAAKAVIPVVGELETFAGAENTDQPGIAIRRKLSTASSQAGGPVAFLRNQSAVVYRTVDRLKEAQAKYKSTIEYPGSSLGSQLKRAAQILAGDLGVRVLYASQDGYDTHSGQEGQHAAILGDLSQSIEAFDRDMAGLGLADKVTLLVFSEFGRRVDENASAGTDHGAASCVLVAGAKVKGGVYGEYPSLEKLGEGDLIYTTDFRSVYATLLDQWLGCPSGKILGSEFAGIGLL